ncbi:IclR family transcriptional regulator [Streptomyces sp. SID13031]|uniref:IclR family transcriptional regulator domain-containing protein n=1 Tax=Streptomyces sp. SID13031 TaxID=2706046 RepID=UPI00194244C1
MSTSAPNLDPAAFVQPVSAVQPVSGTVQSVSRALRAMEFVAASKDGVTAKEIAAHLELALPSAYHLLATLTESGYLVHLAQDHRYGLGYRVRLLEQGLERQLEVPPLIAAAVRRLHLEADAAAYYAVYREVDVVIAHVVDSERRPRVQLLDIGFHEATHATAFGKVMLAAMTGEDRNAYLDRVGLRQCTTNTMTDRRQLETHLEQVRRSGVALEIGEFQDGLSCLAAPVRSSAGAVLASVAISLPSADFATRRWDLERAVRRGALVATRAVNSR